MRFRSVLLSLVAYIPTILLEACLQARRCKSFSAPSPYSSFRRRLPWTSPSCRVAVRLQERSESTVTPTPEPQEMLETPLSDVDARVLQSMLRDEKVDLRTEGDIRKLLERGTVKTSSVRMPTSDEEGDESEFSSTVIKTLTDTKLWKKVSAHASDWFESVSIWVSNKVEQDVKVLAALGLFAWERAVRDVARALPEAGQTGRQVMLLSNSSSYREATSVRAVMEDMNKPSEEIRQVTRAILDILSGEKRSGQVDRGLRSAAPAGTINSPERMRRAYKQRKILERQERDVTRIPGAVVNTAVELKRELSAESSRPGYRTAAIRNAIGAGIAETGRLLREVQTGARLAAAKKKSLRLKEAQEDAKSLRDSIIESLMRERTSVAQRLRLCIKEPENTWLREDVLLKSSTPISFDQDALRDVVTTMMLVRDEIEAKEGDQTYDQLLDDLKSIRGSLEGIRGRAAAATSYGVAEALWEAVIGMYDSDESATPTLLKLDEIEKLMEDTRDIDSMVTAGDTNDEVSRQSAFYAKVDDPVSEALNTSRLPVIDIVDVIQEPVFVPTDLYSRKEAALELDDDVDSLGAGLVAEIVSDDDFDVAVGNPRQVVEAVGDDEESLKENALMMYTLRFLDIVFFVLEKTFTVAIPRTILLVETFSRRLVEVNQGGKGSKGWKPVKNLANPKGRY